MSGAAEEEVADAAAEEPMLSPGVDPVAEASAASAVQGDSVPAPVVVEPDPYAEVCPLTRICACTHGSQRFLFFYLFTHVPRTRLTPGI